MNIGGMRCYRSVVFPLVLSFPLQLVPGWEGKKNKTGEIRNPNSSGTGVSQSDPSNETVKHFQ